MCTMCVFQCVFLATDRCPASVLCNYIHVYNVWLESSAGLWYALVPGLVPWMSEWICGWIPSNSSMPGLCPL